MAMTSRLFIEAASQAALTGSAKVDRARIRTELEQLEKPVSGFLKYQKPYGVFLRRLKMLMRRFRYRSI